MDTPELDQQVKRMRRGCLGKRSFYRDRASAKLGADRVQRTYGYRVKPYRCKFCGWWHLATRKA